MTDLVVIAIIASAMVAFLVARKRAMFARSKGARTVSIDVTTTGVTRHMADGRVESASWSSIQSVEVICTPVRTADDASAFMLLGESEDAGCLVPLGVGLESEVLVHLTRLAGFRLEHLTEAQSHKAPRRTMVWTRS